MRDEVNAFIHRAPVEAEWRVAVKDVIDVGGMPTTAGSSFLDRQPQHSAPAVERLQAAGATVVGKANTHEFALGLLNDGGPAGAVLNPWNHDHVSGGSSGGSAAAVAAGLCDCALGTDTGGSIRVPAAFCGVTGMRPTHSLVPVEGAIPVAWSLDTVGPFARSAEDCARVLSTISARPIALDVHREPRIGVVWPLFEAADPGVAALCEQALEHLPGRHERVEIPFHGDLVTAIDLVMLPEAASVHAEWLRHHWHEYDPTVRARLLTGLLLPATAYVAGRRALRWLREEVERALAAYDLLVAPAMPIVAPRLDAIPADFIERSRPYNAPSSVLGRPATSVPCGFLDGLPVALSLIGRPFEDAAVLAAGHEFQQRTDWHRRVPVPPGEG